MIAPAGGSASNQITVLLKLQGDPKNREEAAKIARDVQSAEVRTTVVVSEQNDRRTKIIQKSTREISRSLKEQTSMQRAELERQQKDREAAAKSNAATEATRQQKKLDSEVEKQQGRIKAGNAQLREGFNQTTEAVLKLGRGFVHLGLVGEQDMKKIVDSLLMVEGIINITRGGMEVYRGLSRAVEGYRAALLAAAAAEKALAAARGAGAAGGVAGAAGAAGGGAAAAGGAGAAGAVAFAAPMAAAVAAIVGVGTAAVAVVDSFRQLIKYGPMAGAEVGSFTDTVATAEVKFAEWIGAIDLGTKKVAAMEAARASMLGSLANQERQRTVRQGAAFGVIDAERDAELERNKIRAATGSQSDLTSNSSNIADAQVNRRRADILLDEARRRDQIAGSSVGPAGDDDTSKKAREAVAERQAETARQVQEAERFRIDAAMRLKDLEGERVEIIRRGGEEALKSLHSQLDVATQIFDKLRSEAEKKQEQLRSDLVRFGQLEAGQQQRVGELKGKLDRGEELTPEEARELRGVGLGSTREQLEEQDIARGKRAGSGAVFGKQQTELDYAAEAALGAASDVADAEARIQEAINANREAINEQMTGAFLNMVNEFEKVLTDSVREAERRGMAAIARDRAERNRGAS